MWLFSILNDFLYFFDRSQKRLEKIIFSIEKCLKKFLYKFYFFFSYLVDPASSHMLVLKIKPCMPKYRWI